MSEEREQQQAASTPPPEPERSEGPIPADDRQRTGLRRRLQRLLDRRELAEDTREVLGGMLEMSDRAKTEAVRLVAREVRNYLEELKIKEDLLKLATSHSLELNLSVKLKPLAEAASKGAAPTQAPPKPTIQAADPPESPPPPVPDPSPTEP